MADGGERAQLVRRFYIGNERNYSNNTVRLAAFYIILLCPDVGKQLHICQCSVYLINDGYAVNGSSITVEFHGTSDVVQFNCFLDNQEFTQCKCTLNSIVIIIVVYCWEYWFPFYSIIIIMQAQVQSPSTPYLKLAIVQDHPSWLLCRETGHHSGSNLMWESPQ